MRKWQDKAAPSKKTIAEKMSAISELKQRRAAQQGVEQKKKLQELLDLQVSVASTLLGKNISSTKV